MDPIFASDAHLLIFFSELMPRFLNDFPEQKLYDSICNGQWRYKSPFRLRISLQQDNAEKAFILVLA